MERLMERGVVCRGLYTPKVGCSHSGYPQGIILVANLPAMTLYVGNQRMLGERNSFSMVVDGERMVGPRDKTRVLSS